MTDSPSLPVCSFLQGSTEDLNVSWSAVFAGDGTDFDGAEYRCVLASRALPYEPLIFSSRPGSDRLILTSKTTSGGNTTLVFALKAQAAAIAGRLGVLSGNLQVLNANGAVDLASIVGTFELRPTNIRDAL